MMHSSWKNAQKCCNVTKSDFRSKLITNSSLASGWDFPPNVIEICSVVFFKISYKLTTGGKAEKIT